MAESQHIDNVFSRMDSIPLEPIHNRLSSSPAWINDRTDESFDYESTIPESETDRHESHDEHHFFASTKGRYKEIPSTTRFYQEDEATKNASIPQDPLVTDKGARNPHIRMWNSIWVNQFVLSGFCALFLALLVGLILLWHFAAVENGLETTITTNHYAWTYGPTALLVIIVAAFRQVDYNCRVLAPWASIQKGANAERGLLLDYVSPIIPKVLGLATYHRDWAVVASTCGTLLLRTLIIFSTALILLTPTQVSTSVNTLPITSKFAGTNYTTVLDIAEVSSLTQYYGTQEKGMTFPFGTTDRVAFDTIDLQSLEPNATVTTSINGFFPHFNCEIVAPEISDFSWYNDGSFPFGDQLNLTFTQKPSSCPTLPVFYAQICQPRAEDCPPRYIRSNDEFWDPSLYDFRDPLDDLDPCAHLYQLIIPDLRYERLPSAPINSSLGWNVTMPNVVGLICASSYTINSLNVAIDVQNPNTTGGVNATGPISEISKVLEGFSYSNFTFDVKGLFSGTQLPVQLNAPNIYGFPLLLAIMNGGFDSILFNTKLLKDTAERAFSGVGAQVAHNYLRQSDNRTTTGTAVFQKQKLQVRIVSVWVMGVGFALLAVVALLIILFRPRNVVPRDPSLIASSAAILAASPDLQPILSETGNLSDSQIKMYLSSTTVQSHATHADGRPRFFMVASLLEGKYASSVKDVRVASSPWRPMSSRRPFMALVIFLPIAIIVVLEVLQRQSDANDGLVDVSSTSFAARSLPSLLASLVMVATAMAYDSVKFATSTLAPFQALKQGNASAKRTLFRNFLGHIPIWSAVDAIMDHHPSAAVASIAAIIGGLLAIVSSGLYSIESVPFPSDVSIAATDKFLRSWSDSTDNAAMAMFNLIEHNNASYPSFTYDELAYPSFLQSSLGASANKQLANSEIVTLRASLPAMRASLNCTVISRSAINRTIQDISTPDSGPGCYASVVDINATLPESCPLFLDSNNKSISSIPLQWSVQHGCQGSAVRGLYSANTQPLNNDVGEFLGPWGSYLGSHINPPECPSLAFIFGYFVENSTDTENITAITCVQGLETVQASTTFQLSGASIQVSLPPAIDENSVEWLTAFNSTYWVTDYPFTQPFLNGSGDVQRYALQDTFTQTVLFGREGIPQEELVGPAHADRYVGAVQHVYRKWMAQFINSNLRQNLTDDEAAAASPYPGVVVDINRFRVKQSHVSKIILQAFLSFMLACALSVYFWRDMRNVLPHNPCSIAGMMSLLAGSEMCERRILTEGAQFMNDKELESVFSGYLFSLGWWGLRREGVDGFKNNLVVGGDGRNAGAFGKRFGIDIGKAEVEEMGVDVVR